ncbi:hypothetical protein KR093_011792 [Drosophila rubida]|uniref:RING-type domain-containing protein n=1 Tax=Drosophila rubida TaxID=30044 RepID=A0AAD4KDE2_9MUSC|nr:hypothetical protein KR093_011792 [Drosophila rubida]
MSAKRVDGGVCAVICGICLENYTSSDTLLAGQCGHVFHETYLDKWKTQCITCPSCRKPCNNHIQIFLEFDATLAPAKNSNQQKQTETQTQSRAQRGQRPTTAPNRSQLPTPSNRPPPIPPRNQQQQTPHVIRNLSSNHNARAPRAGGHRSPTPISPQCILNRHAAQDPNTHFSLSRYPTRINDLATINCGVTDQYHRDLMSSFDDLSD